MIPRQHWLSLSRHSFLKSAILMMLGGATAFLESCRSNASAAQNQATNRAGIAPVSRINYPQLGVPVGPYVHATRYNGLLFVSGLTAFGTAAQRTDLASQAKSTLSQIQEILKSEKIGVEQILKVTIFVTDLSEAEGLRDVLFNFYQGKLPASSLIQVQKLFAPELKIEIEAIVALPTATI
jgi:2-iminobutanoate/2-iminopropanoate deaminase